MSNIVPFNNDAQLPAHLQKRRGNKSSDLTQGVGPGIAKMSIKGKIWAIVRGDDRQVVMNPKDPESPASFVGVAIVAASPNLSRTFYVKDFDEKAASMQPDCSSVDGIKPDNGVPHPQAKTCAACPHAAYGTGQNGKGFRCPNHRRLVIAKPGEYTEEGLMLLNVPGGSLKNLRDFSMALDKREVDYDAVLTKLTFDSNEATPKIIFTPVGFLPEEHYKAVQELATSSAVQAILGSSEATVQGTEDAVASGDQVPDDTAAEKEAEAAKKAEAAAAAAAKKAAEAAKKAAEEDAALAAAGDPEPSASPADGLMDDLDAMLAQYDD